MGKRERQEIGLALADNAMADPLIGQVFSQIVGMIAVLVQHADPPTAQTGGKSAQLHVQVALGGCRRHSVGPCMAGGVQKAAAPERSRLSVQGINSHG
ncbi:hypothetical protein GCM10007913_03080 [Devosia yakushimensis]|uniref:Uncharacterized protein n=1 Tax=Devosia yakushimensis TaxID=470028 RepID=A0ABQ5UAD5_9HYPH|nr:hypothetical protein GCM10007913_03080 [Devosia yakushimensis]